ISEQYNANQIIIKNFGRLTIYGGGGKLTIIDDFVHTPLLVEAGGVLENIGTLDLQSQLSVTPCEIYGTLESFGSIQASNPALLLFHSGSLYQHANNSGGNIPLATWNINSTCMITGLSLANPVRPNNLGQEFGHFVWNTLSFGIQNVTPFSLAGNLQMVRGNLTIASTGLSNPRILRFDNGSDGYNLHVGGNFIVQNGLVTLTQSHTTATTISISGDLKASGGSLTFGITNNAAINILLKGQLEKTGGTLDRGTGTGVCKILALQ
ncbi:MAG: hypothetical protein C0490_15310, partial [Marivirga sp.]|nr:hypothetical protein [Marivirga sp.]